MKAYHVDLTATPSAGEPLTALYLASRTGPVNGKHSKERKRLARAVGPGKLAELLASGKPIRVLPRSGSLWEVQDAEPNSDPGRLLIAAVKDAMASQSLTQTELARRSGVQRPTLSRILSGRIATVDFADALALLRGVGRSLSWFETQLPDPERT